MDDLCIQWETGHMIIHMDSFFPCGIQKFKKVLKVIELDWRHEKELKEILKVNFQNRIPALVELWKENSKKYYDFKQKEADTTRLIEIRKYPNGLPISKDELKQTKADLRKYKAAWKKALTDAKSNKHFKEQIERYLELL